MGLLGRVHGVKLRDKVRRCEFRCACVLNVQPLLWIQRSRLHWFGHVSRMPHERLARQSLLAKVMSKRLRACSRTRRSESITTLFGPVLVWSQQNYLRLLLTVRCFAYSWGCCHRHHPQRNGGHENEWMNKVYNANIWRNWLKKTTKVMTTYD